MRFLISPLFLEVNPRALRAPWKEFKIASVESIKVPSKSNKIVLFVILK